MARQTYGLNVFSTIPDISWGEFVEDFASLPAVIHDPEVIVTRTSNHTTVEVPPGIEVKNPICLEFLPHASPRLDHISIIVHKGSKVSIHEAAAEGRAAQKLLVDVQGEEGSDVTYTVLPVAGGRTFFGYRKVALAASAKLNWWNVSLSGEFVLDEFQCALYGEGASLNHQSIFFGDQSEHLNFYVGVEHDASHTTSDIRGRSVLDSAAKAIVRGMIRMPRGIHGARGYQKEDTLLLGDKAEIDALPHLEILSDDVVCGHGASLGELNREHLFYLQSRGLSDDAAQRVLVEGFFVPIIQEIKDAAVRRKIQEALHARINVWKTQQT